MFGMLKLTLLTTLTAFRLEDDVTCFETSKTRYMQRTLLGDKERVRALSSESVRHNLPRAENLESISSSNSSVLNHVFQYRPKRGI